MARVVLSNGNGSPLGELLLKPSASPRARRVALLPRQEGGAAPCFLH